MSIWRRINWLNTIFLILTPIVGITGTVLLTVFGMVYWPTWVLLGGMYVISLLGISMGYHRLFSHPTYKAAWPLRLILVLFASATFEGSAFEWSTDHRKHHLYTDTDKDPYDINRGFWYAHIGWLLTLDTSQRDFSNIKDLQKDPILRFQHKYFVLLAVLMGFGLPTLIGALWGNALAGFIIGGVLRTVLTHHSTFCINSVCHIFGKRTYSDEQSAVDSWFTALLTFGEGYHNFHHQFPLDYRNGVRLYHYDPSKWLIYGLSFLGITKKLNRMSKTRIIRYRLRNDEKNLTKEGKMSHLFHAMHERMLQLIKHIEELEKSYKEAKKSGLASMQHKIDEYKISLKKAKRELKYSFSLWVKAMRNPKTLLLAEG